jgi:Ca-activated chloride channel homolog
MCTTHLTKTLLAYCGATAALASFAVAQSGVAKAAKEAATPARSAPRTQIQVPNRPSTPLFQGEQGKQKAEIYFDPATQVVTIKMLVQDPNGYFIPNIRRDNFVVYENDMRQQNATVEVEHGPVSIGLLVEHGGRLKALNKALGEGVSSAANQFLPEIGPEDKIAIWKYGDKFEEISDFSPGHGTPEASLVNLQPPPFSELNFYDALVTALTKMQPLSGRKALILISSGLDTFSKANYQNALRVVRQARTPIYVVNLGPSVQESASLLSSGGPYVRIDWNRAESDLQEIAQASGGRMYSPKNTFNLSGIYDDLMENLRVRYVITYKSSSDRNLSTARTVRIELVDSKTGGPLEIVDANGKLVRSKIFVEGSYIPRNATVTGLDTSASKAAKE